MTDASLPSSPRASTPSPTGGSAPDPRSSARGRGLAGGPRPADRIFRGVSIASAVLIMVILAGVALFLIVKASPAFTASWTSGDLAQGATKGNTSFWSYTGPLIWGTLFISVIGLIIGTPVAIGIALFISHYSARRLSGVLGYIVDLLAAVPSIIFGLWGIFTIRPFLLPFENWLSSTLGWIPFFSGQVSTTGSTALAGAIVLAVMVLPIITSISREIFLQTPRLHEEAALALGATKWEMVRLAVFPYARSGIVSAVLLGFGRALGETMAIAMIMSPALQFSLKLITDNLNSQTIAANIALNFPESSDLQRSALIGTGLMLFVISLVVNFAARYFVSRATTTRAGKPRKHPLPAKEAAVILAEDAVLDSLPLPHDDDDSVPAITENTQRSRRANEGVTE